MPRAENILLSAFLIFKHKGAFFMKVMEFSENTKVDCVVPEWAEFMDKDDHISYMPSFKGGEFLGLFDERICTAPENQPPFDSMTCYLFDPTKHGRDRNGKYPLLIFIHGATNALDGRKCVSHSGGEMFASPDYQDRMGGAFILVPLANERRDENGMLADSWDVGIASLYFGIEMGQHCIITQVQADLMYDDASPYCEALPHGVTGWVKELVSGVLKCGQ